MKYSKKRVLILSAIKQNVVHQTADYLYGVLRKTNPNISLATVYRNLNQMSEAGIIKKITGIDGTAHFDHNTFEHFHFICTKCNRVFDVRADIVSDIEQKVLKDTGLLIENFEIAMKGTCPDCISKN